MHRSNPMSKNQRSSGKKQCFAVTSMFISSYFQQSLILKALEMFLVFLFFFELPKIFSAGDRTVDFLEQNNSSSVYSNLTQYFGLTQLLPTPTRITISSIITIASLAYFSTFRRTRPVYPKKTKFLPEKKSNEHEPCEGFF